MSYLQRTIGNQAVGRLIKSGWLQRKLNIGPANDKYEQEADAVADKVVSLNEPPTGSGDSLGNSPPGETQQISRKSVAESITPLQRESAPEEEEAQGKSLQREAAPEEEDVQKASAKEDEELKGKFLQRKCASCEKEEAQAKFLQKKSTGSTPASSSIESSINTARGGGRSLSPGERSYYEPRFGASFAGVKIHTDSKAAQLSRSVNARAFTVGNEVFFGAGEYSPNTVQGKRLMAHELTHTVQQKGDAGGSTKSVPQKKIQRVKVNITNHVGLEKAKVLSAVKVAERMVNKAQIYIGGKKRGRYKLWFDGNYDPKNPVRQKLFDWIKFGWVKIHSVFKSRTINIDCSKRKGNYFAYVDVVDGKYLIYLGKLFWNAALNGRDS
ncbi:MAG: DUF4157 domain-containing protein [Leptospirales bacterium]